MWEAFWCNEKVMRSLFQNGFKNWISNHLILGDLNIDTSSRGLAKMTEIFQFPQGRLFERPTNKRISWLKSNWAGLSLVDSACRKQTFNIFHLILHSALLVHLGNNHVYLHMLHRYFYAFNWLEFWCHLSWCQNCLRCPVVSATCLLLSS